MKIGLFTDTYVPEINGVVNSVLMLCEGLREAGHDVWVFAPGHPDADVDEFQVVRTHATSLPVLKERRLALPFSAKVWAKVKELNLDIVHTHTEFGVGSFGFRARKQLGIPHVHTYHTVWEEYTHYIAPEATLDYAQRAVRATSSAILNRANHIIVPTQKTSDLLTSYGVSKPISVVPTGVDLTRFSPVGEGDEARLDDLKREAGTDDSVCLDALKREVGIDDSVRLKELKREVGTNEFSQTLLLIGRIAPEKSVRELVDMTLPYLRQHPEAGLLVVGGGPSLKELQKLAVDTGMKDQMRFTGEIAWDRVPDMYRISDVLVGNSSTETQGLTFIEAAACGVPVITRYNSCFDGVLKDGKDATLFTDTAQFLPALEQVCEPEFRTARIEAGLTAARAISKEAFAAKVEDVYVRALTES